MAKVLFLTPWYPSEKDAMSGLFVQKHVEAVRAQGIDVRVICSQGWRDTWRQWKTLQRERWMPDVVQLNVIQKQGVLALWLKKRYHIPYIIIEHWSGYLSENGQFLRMSAYKRRLYQRIAAQAEKVLCVSQRHMRAMQECGIQAKEWGLIHNVVDEFFFEPSAVSSQPSDRKTLLHISCFDERAKNVKGLLRAAKMLSEKRQDWRLVLVGTGVDYQQVREFAASLDIPDGLLEWTGELTPQQVSDAFDQADIFVLPSNYENAPVVISESLAKGVPVVASLVGGIPEMVPPNCGILVTPGNTEELAAALDKMLDCYPTYDKQVIRQAGEQYAFAKVGAALKEIYESVL